MGRILFVVLLVIGGAMALTAALIYLAPFIAAGVILWLTCRIILVRKAPTKSVDNSIITVDVPRH